MPIHWHPYSNLKDFHGTVLGEIWKPGEVPGFEGFHRGPLYFICLKFGGGSKFNAFPMYGIIPLGHNYFVFSDFKIVQMELPFAAISLVSLRLDQSRSD